MNKSGNISFMPNMKSNNKAIKMYKNYTGLFYILPWIIGFLVFQLYPLGSSLYYSVTNYSLGRSPVFIGIKNFIEIFTIDPTFIQSAKATIIYVLMAVPLKLAFALFIAVILSASIKHINIFRTVFYIPSILSGSVAVAIVWRAMFLKTGVINNILAYIHLLKIDWFGTPFMALITISLLPVWQFGSSMVLFLAGLKQIPQVLYEAGKIDGASKIRMFFVITVPLLTPIVFFNLVMEMINAFQEFTAAFLVTNGGPLRGTYLYGMKLYDEAFANFRVGYACALSWVLFTIILGLTLIIFRSSGSWVYYEDGGDF